MNSPESPNNPSKPSEQSSDWDSLSNFKFTPFSYSSKFNALRDDRAAKAAEREKKRHLAILKKIEDMSHLSPVEQLKRLSDFWEKAEADTWYAVSDAKDLFYTLDGDTRFSPFIQLVAKAAKSSDPNDYHYYAYKDDTYNINENYGYDSFIRLDSLPYENDPELNKLTEAELKTKLDQAKDMDEETPLPRPYADWFSYEADLELALARIYYAQNQKRLQEEFPSLSNSADQLIRIAPDAAISVNLQEKYDSDIAIFSWSGSLDMLSDDNGRVVSMAEATNGGPNSLGLDKDMLTYLEAVHCNPDIKDVIEKTLSLKITEIPLDAQVHLLKFMTEADSIRFDTLCNTLKNTPEDIRQKLAESFFIVSNFDDSLGDSLLDIANSDRLDHETLDHLLTSLNSCQKSIKDISSLYSQLDNGEFSNQYALAANERLADILVAFRQIANTGKAEADLDWAGKTKFSLDTALEALDYEEKSLDIINGTISDVVTGKPNSFAERILSPDDYHGRSVYNFYSPNYGYTLLYIRPEGSGTFDSLLEYGRRRSKYSKNANNSGIEASISFIVDPVDPFARNNPIDRPNPYRPDHKKIRDPSYYDSSTMNKVSAIRLDREGRSLDSPSNSPDRDPISPTGTISVDLAAIGDRADTPSGKIARLISTGNKLRQESEDSEFNLNHNTRWFNQPKYGSESGFRRLAEHIQKNADILCALRPPTKRIAHPPKKSPTKHRYRTQKPQQP